METPSSKYQGVIIPMVTPLKNNLSIDEVAVEKILNSFLQGGVHPFLLGTTGESMSITNEKKARLVQATLRHADSKLTVYAGISGNCLEESIINGKKYADMGVDALVAHLPFFYPLSSGQMIKYYEQLADNLPCPLILYNNPVTTKFSVPLDVVDQLSYHSNIAGLKDSEKGLERLNKALELWAQRRDFVHLTGCAAQSSYALLNGSDGIVPSTGNLTPKLYSHLYDLAVQNKSQEANDVQTQTDQVSEVLQKGRNLSQAIPALKYMMYVHSLCEPYVMPPMYELNEDEKRVLREEMSKELNTIEF